MKHVKASVCILALLNLTGCNIFNSLDKPSNDAQYRTAAEACLDENNFNCAEEYLSKISTNDLDSKLSLSVYMGLLKAGISPGKLMKALYDNLVSDTSSNSSQASLSQQMELNSIYFPTIGTPSNIFSPPPPSSSTTCQLAKEHSYGMLLTVIAKLIDHPSSEGRQALFDSTIYKSYQIQSTTQSKYLGFISTLTFLAYLLAENQSTPNTLKMSDFVQNPSGCLSVLKGTSADLSLCSAPSGSKLKLGKPINYQNAIRSDFSGDVTMGMISSGVLELAVSIQRLEAAEFDVGKLEDSLPNLNTQFGPSSTTFIGCGSNENSDCPPFRATLLNASIGDCR